MVVFVSEIKTQLKGSRSGKNLYLYVYLYVYLRLCRKAQRDREKVEELRIITEERNARNAELQRRIELRKLAKLKKKKQEEVPSHFFQSFKNVKKVDEAVIQSAELVVRELTEIVTNKVFSPFFSLKILRL